MVQLHVALSCLAGMSGLVRFVLSVPLRSAYVICMAIVVIDYHLAGLPQVIVVDEQLNSMKHIPVEHHYSG